MKGKLRYMSLKFEPPKNNIIFTPSDRIKKAKRNKVIFNSIILSVVGVLAFISVKYISAWKKQNDALKNSELIYDEINDYVGEKETATLPPETLDSSETAAPGTNFQKVNFDKLLEINSDAYGWIEVTGLDISYPVAKATDNDFYIGNSFKKEPSINGSVFRDYRCNEDSDLTIIYGHRSADGSMFYPLDLLDSTYANNKIIITNEKTYIYDVWAVAHVPSTGDAYRINFTDSWTFDKYIEYIKSYAVNTTSHIDKVDDTSTLLMLSTCISTSKHPYRRVVCAYLTQVID